MFNCPDLGLNTDDGSEDGGIEEEQDRVNDFFQK
jgi:hypothetical protein